MQTVVHALLGRERLVTAACPVAAAVLMLTPLFAALLAAEPAAAETAVETVAEAAAASTAESAAGITPEVLPTEEVIVTASQWRELIFETPYSASIITGNRIRQANFRTTPDMFREVPGAFVQKTAHGQGSPYIRGFTGFRNLFMIDGIRLNNAVFREGPNQYWSTVDPLAINRVEVVRGPKSVLYGSDAIGGTVNAFTRGPSAYSTADAKPVTGGLYYRHGTSEHSNIVGLQGDVALGKQAGLLLAGSVKDFGDIESGKGDLPNTGYDEWSMDGKFIYDRDSNTRLTVSHAEVHQDNVPRTHRTTASRPFQGTTIGDELQRELDQDRALSYARIELDRALGWQDWRLTLFNHRQKESRKRLRTGDRRDTQSVKVDTLGAGVATSLETNRLGVFTVGADWARDRVNSASSNNSIQGPVADDASYDWGGIYLQNRIDLQRGFDLTTGVRLGYFSVDADSVSDPVDGSEISLAEDWTKTVGNLRLGWTSQSESWRVYGGLSQGFRAPNLSDLTRFDSARSNEFEIPAPDLDPEDYLQTELGLRFSTGSWELEAATYYTDIRNQIQRVLTGTVNANGEQEVTKANVGDGDLYGVEISGNWLLGEQWRAFGQFSWLDGKIGNEAVAGAPTVDDNHSRTMPTNYRFGLRFQPRRWWLEGEVIRVEKADQLSLRDKEDTQRIPPGGTPAYTLFNLRGGFAPLSGVEINIALENITDEDYRVHGSGQNEVGRNLVVAMDYTF